MLRAPGQYDSDALSNETGLKCEDVSLAVQSEKDNCDINILLERFAVTGRIPVVPVPSELLEFGEIFDFRIAMDVLNTGKKAFSALPAKTRAYFDNDPEAFVAFCGDSANLPELRRLGLAEPEKPAPVEPAPMKVQVVNAEVAQGQGAANPK